MQCQYQNCRFTTDAVEVREENLRCANRKAQLAMEIRASSTSRTDICVKCKGKRAAKVRNQGRFRTLKARTKRPLTATAKRTGCSFTGMYAAVYQGIASKVGRCSSGGC